MTITRFTLDVLDATSFESSTTTPPYARFLPGSRVEETQVAGPELPETGAVVAMRVHEGGFEYTDTPGPESGFIVAGEAVVRDADGEYALKAGDGYYFPPAWSGVFQAVTPVTKVFYVL